MRDTAAYIQRVAAALITAAALPASAWATAATPVSAWNFNLPTPSGSPTNFEIYLPGDQVGVDSTHFNAFTGTDSNTSTSYDAVHNQTVISFTGSSSGLGANPHFGFSGVIPGQLSGTEGILPPVPATWSYASSPLVPVPVIGINFTSLGSNLLPVDYFVLEIKAEFPDADVGGSDGDEATNWYELPYQGSYSYSLAPSAGQMDISGAQYFISPSQIPLDQLNPGLDPATQGTSWTPIPQYTNDTLLPEPATLLLFSVGLAGLGIARRRTKPAAR